jgi:hypothetical protein
MILTRDWTKAACVAAYMRDADRREIEAGLRSWVEFEEALKHHAAHAPLFHVACLDDLTPVAVVSAVEFAPRVVMLNLFATDDFPLIVRPLLRWSLRVAKPHLFALGYRRAEARSIAGHDEAHRMLIWLGFRCECALPDFGKNGETFLQFAWRISDHVLLQSPENSAAAQAAA